MNITMQNLERLSLAEMKEFVEGNRRVHLSTETGEQSYGLVEATLHTQHYRKLSKGAVKTNTPWTLSWRRARPHKLAAMGSAFGDGQS